jgi:hypothetical protein
MQTDMQACLECAQDVEAAHNARRMLVTSGAAAASLRLMSCAIVVTGVAASNVPLGHRTPSTCQDVREVLAYQDAICGVGHDKVWRTQVVQS